MHDDFSIALKPIEGIAAQILVDYDDQQDQQDDPNRMTSEEAHIARASAGGASNNNNYGVGADSHTENLDNPTNESADQTEEEVSSNGIFSFFFYQIPGRRDKLVG